MVIFRHSNPVATTHVSDEPVSTIVSKVCSPKVIFVANSSPISREMRPVVRVPVGYDGLLCLFRRYAALRALGPFGDFWRLRVRVFDDGASGVDPFLIVAGEETMVRLSIPLAEARLEVSRRRLVNNMAALAFTKPIEGGDVTSGSLMVLVKLYKEHDKGNDNG